MECIFCGNKFSSTSEADKVCTPCERAIERLHIGMTPDRLFELSKAEKAGRLAVLPNENYYWRIRGDIALGVIMANCRAAQMEAEAAARKEAQT